MTRIIDLTGIVGSYATRLFVEEGHEVIRVEKAEGDDLRRMPPFLADKKDLEHSAYHQFLNAGKKSLTLDLNSASGRKLFIDLLGRSDVLVAEQPLPVDEQLCIEANPKLVITKVENDAPEICAMARSGLLSLTGQPNQAPMLLGAHIPYLAVGAYVGVATAAALLASKSSGRGIGATVSVRQSLESFVEQAMVEYSFSRTITERRGSKGAITAISGALPCKNGHWVISQIHRAGRWEKFVDWVQDPDLSSDLSLAQEENQHKHRDFIMDRLHAWAKRFTKDELVEEAQRRHFPASPVSTTLDLIDDPQLVARGFLREMNHPLLGRIMFPRGAIATVTDIELTPAPRLGQHNEEILSELGYALPERDTFNTNA
jgi:crotonobetainyl-CoA:carnitine CoA-transferase CaiB-like acyl-CoA transferase